MKFALFLKDDEELFKLAEKMLDKPGAVFGATLRGCGQFDFIPKDRSASTQKGLAYLCEGGIFSFLKAKIQGANAKTGWGPDWSVR